MERLLSIVGWRRILVTMLCLVVWSLVYQTPLIGLDLNRLGALVAAQTRTGSAVAALGSSEPFAQYSVGALGVTPYVDAIVIMTFATLVSPRLRVMRWSAKGIGRYRLWTRAIAIGLAGILAYGRVGFFVSGGLLPEGIPTFPWFVIAAEITAGTAVLIAVADVMDEYGLGLGFGPLWLYALGPVAFEAHRIAAWIDTAPSLEALYMPLLVWTAASIAIATLTVAAAGAYRLVATSREGDDNGSSRTYSIAFLTSGVLRPVIMAYALVDLPVAVAYVFNRSNPGLANLILSSWLPAGPNPWWSAGYLATAAICIVVTTYMVVFADSRFELAEPVAHHLWRLTMLCGLFLVLAVVLAPELEMLGTSLAGRALPLSGFDAVLVVALVFSAVVTLRPIRRPRAIAVQVPAFP